MTLQTVQWQSGRGDSLLQAGIYRKVSEIGRTINHGYERVKRERIKLSKLFTAIRDTKYQYTWITYLFDSLFIAILGPAAVMWITE